MPDRQALGTRLSTTLERLTFLSTFRKQSQPRPAFDTARSVTYLYQ